MDSLSSPPSTNPKNMSKKSNSPSNRSGLSLFQFVPASARFSDTAPIYVNKTDATKSAAIVVVFMI